MLVPLWIAYIEAFTQTENPVLNKYLTLSSNVAMHIVCGYAVAIELWATFETTF